MSQNNVVSTIQHCLEMVVGIKTPNCDLQARFLVGGWNSRRELEEWRRCFRDAMKAERVARRSYEEEAGIQGGTWFDMAAVKLSLPVTRDRLYRNAAGGEVILEAGKPEEFAKHLYRNAVYAVIDEVKAYADTAFKFSFI